MVTGVTLLTAEILKIIVDSKPSEYSEENIDLLDNSSFEE